MIQPEPFTPLDCDLRGMEWMPLFGARLFMSDFEARATDEEFRAAVRLWWMAWQQVPAASLPEDDAVLCRLAGLGRDIKTWKKVKVAALHGFTLCSDGRYYHKLLSVQAKISWDKRIKERDRKAAYRAKKDGGGTGTSGGHDADVPRDTTRMMNGTGQSHAQGPPGDEYGDVRVDKTRQDRTGQDRTKKKEESERERSAGASAHAALAPKTIIPEDWVPDEDGVLIAKESGISDLVANVEKFVDYYAADGTPKADWQAQWRRWCRREPELRRNAR